MHVWKLSMLLVFFNKHFQCICLLHSGQRWMCEMHRNHIQLERERCVVKPCHRWSLHFDFCPQSWKDNPQRGSHRAVYQTNGSSESLASDQTRNPCGHGNVHVFVSNMWYVIGPHLSLDPNSRLATIWQVVHPHQLWNFLFFLEFLSLLLQPHLVLLLPEQVDFQTDQEDQSHLSSGQWNIPLNPWHLW